MTGVERARGPGNARTEAYIGEVWYNLLWRSGLTLIGPSTFGYSCTTPEASGTRNYSSDPCFLDTWHLSTSEVTSPIFGKGLKFGWMASAFDLDGNPRLRNGKVTPGCYEDFWFSLPLVIRLR